MVQTLESGWDVIRDSLGPRSDFEHGPAYARSSTAATIVSAEREVTSVLRLTRSKGRACRLRQSRWGGWLPLPALQRQGGAVTQHELGATTMEITTVGIDLAKNVFQVHAVSQSGEVIVRRALRRAQVIPFFAKLPS